MGYQLTVTRAEYPWSPGEISDDVWRAVVATDSELSWCQDDYHVIDGVKKHPVAWQPPGDSEPRAFFWHANDAVTVKWADSATKRKLCQLAAELSASVLGEDGEAYDDRTRARMVGQRWGIDPGCVTIDVYAIARGLTNVVAGDEERAEWICATLALTERERRGLLATVLYFASRCAPDFVDDVPWLVGLLEADDRRLLERAAGEYNGAAGLAQRIIEARPA